MKILSACVLLLAGAGLAWIAFRAPAPSYVAPTEAEVAAHRAAPQELEGEVPAECTLLTISVDGMCCTGCTGKLYDRLRSTPGFVDGAVSFEDARALVVVRKESDPAAFARALEFDKYTAKLVP